MEQVNLIQGWNAAGGILVVGNGIAGLMAAETARKIDHNIPIMLISDEDYLTYYRLRLCELLKGSSGREELYIHNENWYKERNISVILGKSVKQICPDQKKAVLAGGEEFTYSRLIIALGSQSFIPDIPGTEKKHIYSIRSLNDVQSINNCALGLKKAAIIGGGLLGLEAAYQLNKRGICTKIIEYMPRLLPKQLDQKGSEIFESKVKSLGIEVIKGVSVESITGGDTIEGLKLNNGMNIYTEMAIFASGVRPNVNIVKGSGIGVNRGIIVDSRMRTNIEGIYAAGDVAEYDGKLPGMWSVAMMQGKIAGTNAVVDLMNKNKSPKDFTYMDYRSEQSPYFLNSMNTQIYSIGKIDIDDFEGTEDYKQVNEGEYIYRRLLFKDDIIIGAVLIGDTRNAIKINDAVRKGLSRQEVEKL